jgi:hypothetical protein
MARDQAAFPRHGGEALRPFLQEAAASFPAGSFFLSQTKIRAFRASVLRPFIAYCSALFQDSGSPRGGAETMTLYVLFH